MDGGELKFHHGSVTVDHLVDAALDEIVEWANANAKSAEEIVLLHAFTCSGDGCDAALSASLAAHHISFVTDCAELSGLSLQDAAARAKLPGGGLVLAVKDCLVDHYVENVACSGYGSTAKSPANVSAAEGEPSAVVRAEGAPSVELDAVESDSLIYTCYADSSSKDFPLNRMWSYLADVSTTGPPSNGYLYSHQALWQETEASVVVGVTHASSLIGDEEGSKLNALLAARVTSGAWDVSAANLVEINNVCDGGPALLAALRKAQQK